MSTLANCGPQDKHAWMWWRWPLFYATAGKKQKQLCRLHLPPWVHSSSPDSRYVRSGPVRSRVRSTSSSRRGLAVQWNDFEIRFQAGWSWGYWSKVFGVGGFSQDCHGSREETENLKRWLAIDLDMKEESVGCYVSTHNLEGNSPRVTAAVYCSVAITNGWSKSKISASCTYTIWINSPPVPGNNSFQHTTTYRCEVGGKQAKLEMPVVRKITDLWIMKWSWWQASNTWSSSLSSKR